MTQEEEFVIAKGWIKQHGFKVDHSGFSSDYTHSFWTKECLNDFVVETDFWDHPDYENAYDNPDQIIEIEYDDEFSLWLAEKNRGV